jgi:hypothetical protein
MIRNRRQPKDPRQRILRKAEDLVSKPEVEQSDDITRIGIVWAGILDLDNVLPPTTVAAMLAASELVMATSTVDSEEHWVGAAAYAALGAYNESEDTEMQDATGLPRETNKLPKIGFSAPIPPST